MFLKKSSETILLISVHLFACNNRSISMIVYSSELFLYHKQILKLTSENTIFPHANKIFSGAYESLIDLIKKKLFNSFNSFCSEILILYL